MSWTWLIQVAVWVARWAGYAEPTRVEIQEVHPRACQDELAGLRDQVAQLTLAETRLRRELAREEGEHALRLRLIEERMRAVFAGVREAEPGVAALVADLAAHKAKLPRLTDRVLVIPPTLGVPLPTVRAVVDDVDAHAAPGTSGEWKRHETLARLTKHAPHTPIRDLALAIELAMRGPHP